MIAIYTRHKLEESSIKLKYYMGEISTSMVFSEENLCHNNIFDLSSIPKFNNIKTVFSAQETDDIIARCRVLRYMDEITAKRLIQEKTEEIEIFLKEFKIKCVIIPRVDDFFLDILTQICLRTSINLVGVWQSAFFKDYSFLTVRGEYTYFNQSEKELCNDLKDRLSSSFFKGTSLNSNNTLKIRAKKYIYLNFRAFLLEIKYRFNRNYSYRNLATKYHVSEYKTKLVHIVPKWFVKTEMNLDFLENIQAKKLYVALQVNPESTIDYYCKNVEWIKVESVLTQIIIEARKAGLHVLIKDHPNMEGFRPKSYYDLIKREIKLGGINLIATDVPSTEVLDIVDVVFTWTGTVGVEALLRGKTVITVDHPFIDYHPNHYKASNIKNLGKIFNDILTNKITLTSTFDLENTKILKKICDSAFPGKIYYHSDQGHKYSMNKPTLFLEYIRNILE